MNNKQKYVPIVSLLLLSLSGMFLVSSCSLSKKSRIPGNNRNFDPVARISDLAENWDE